MSYTAGPLLTKLKPDLVPESPSGIFPPLTLQLVQQLLYIITVEEGPGSLGPDGPLYIIVIF